MAVITMTYPARCKHCENFTTARRINKSGNPSKKREGFCSLKNEFTPARTTACDKFK